MKTKEIFNLPVESIYEEKDLHSKMIVAEEGTLFAIGRRWIKTADGVEKSVSVLARIFITEDE